jgi:hypothetical protein
MLEYFKKNKWFFPIGLLIFLVPLALNLFFIYGDVKTGTELGNVEWLAFWGSYLGGAATLFAVFLTLSQNMKVIKQNKKIIIQNQENLNFQEERSRIALMPYIDVRVLIDPDLHKSKLQPPNGFITLYNQDSATVRSDLPKHYHEIIELSGLEETKSNGVITLRASKINFVRIIMTQKAPNLARNIELSVCKNGDQEKTGLYLTPSFVLASGESVKLPILFDRDFREGDYKFTLSFEDIEGRSYKQFFTILHKGNAGYSFFPVSSPKLQNDSSAKLDAKTKI